MNSYAEVLTYAIPFFIVLILIEWGIGAIKGKQVIRSFDTVSSLSSGLSNITKDILGLAIIIVSYSWMVKNFAVMEIEATWLLYVLAFVGLDFAGYWSHRFEHEINIFWNRHIVHHSSEEFNLACALRQTVSAVFRVFFFLMIPMAILGVPGKVIGVVAPLQLFAQFWYHTRLINKMGFLEHIIVTPSHHRVHHAINEEYLDKNYSQIFIIWDKLFGTFQKELDDVPAVFGVKRQVNTWNPFIINYQHFWLLLTDAFYTRNWWDKIRIWFMPTGWRPADRLENAPVEVIEDPYSQVKYTTNGSVPFHIWAWVSFVATLALALYFFNKMGDISEEHILGYGLFIMTSIFAYTSLMDRHILSLPVSVFTTLLGISIYQSSGGWFGIGDMWGYAILAYLVLISILAFYFYFSEPLEKSGEHSEKMLPKTAIG